MPDLDNLGRRVGLEPQFAVEPTGQTRVHGEEFVNHILIAGPDKTSVEAVRLEFDQQLVDGFHADHVGCAVLVTFDQLVELVHENDSAKRFFDQFLRLGA